jgi:protein-disulfide isomerase
MSDSSNRAADSAPDDGDDFGVAADALSPEDLALRRERARRDRRRSRNAVLGAFGSVVAIAVGLVGFGYWTTHHKPAYVVPKHTGIHTDGIVAGGTGKTRVDVYVDYNCGSCKAFAISAVNTLNQAIAANKITLVYHPLALDDAADTSQYSTRAAASAACASDMGAFLAYSNMLFTDEPLTPPTTKTAPPPAPKKIPTLKATVKPSHRPTHTATHKPTPKATPKPAPRTTPVPIDLTDDQLVQVGGAAGIINPSFAECLRSGTYEKWVENENSMARDAHITSTPTVLVNGASIAPAGAVPTLAELAAAIG